MMTKAAQIVPGLSEGPNTGYTPLVFLLWRRKPHLPDLLTDEVLAPRSMSSRAHSRLPASAAQCSGIAASSFAASACTKACLFRRCSAQASVSRDTYTRRLLIVAQTTT